MPKLTWLGEADCVWNGVTFQPGVPVDIDDPYMIGKARNSPFFKVDATSDVSFFDDPPDEVQSGIFTIKRKRGRRSKVRQHADH